MKFILTESKLESIIFKYLDNQDFVKIKKAINILFINSSNDKYFQIAYSKYDGFCYIYVGLITEISSFFSIEFSDSKKLISKWVENTLQMKVKTTDTIYNNFYPNLHR